MKQKKCIVRFCHICDKEVRYLGRHLSKHHSEISELEYYNTYLKESEKDGFCKYCGKPLKFHGVLNGYGAYCNAQCQMKDPDMQKRFKQNYFEKTGYTHNFKNPKVIAQIKKTQTEKYGGIGFASKELREKVYAHSDYENSMHNPETVKKMIESRRKHFNGNYYSEQGLQAIHETNILNDTPENCQHRWKVRRERYGKTGMSLHAKQNRLEKIQKFYHTKYNVNILLYKFEDNNCVCKCNVCNKEYTINYTSLHTRLKASVNPCTFCNPLDNRTTSFEEKDLLSYIQAIYSGQIIENDRFVLDGKELDIYLPEKRLAFEFNGLYWHNEMFLPNDYHKNKTNSCESKGVQLIHIFEDDWHCKQDIVKSRISSLIGRIEHKNLRQKMQSIVD